MNDSELLAIFDREVRQKCEWTRMSREEFPNIVRYTLDGVGSDGGYISWSALTADTADSVIKEQIAHYKALNLEFEWKLYTQDQPADLPKRLMAHGFKPDEPEALMVIDIKDLPDEYWRKDVSCIKKVTTSEEIDAIVEMENEVWGEDLSNTGKGLKFDLVNHPKDVSVFTVSQNGRVVSAAWTYYLMSTSFASLWGGSTLKDYRNRGYYSALLAARASEARFRGYRYLQVDASAESRPILEKNGFRFLGFSTPYNWKP